MNSEMFSEESDHKYRSRALDLITNSLAKTDGHKRDTPSLTDEEIAAALDLDIDSYKVWLQELSTLMGSAINGLQEMERMVVTLHYYEELTMKEIAGVLGLTESQATQFHSEAIVRLTKNLNEKGDLDDGN